MTIYQCPICGQKRWGHTADWAKTQVDRHIAAAHPGLKGGQLTANAKADLAK